MKMRVRFILDNGFFGDAKDEKDTVEDLSVPKIQKINTIDGQNQIETPTGENNNSSDALKLVKNDNKQENNLSVREECTESKVEEEQHSYSIIPRVHVENLKNQDNVKSQCQASL